MISELQRAFDALIQSGELGKTDAQYINTLLPSISGDGLISKDEVIRQLFAGSKNPDGACRNFFSRIHAAAAQAAEAAQEQGDERRAAMFRSIDIRKSSAAAGLMQFAACAPKELPPVTARANRDYLPENYQPSTGCKPEDLPQLQREELSRRQEKAEEKRHCCLLEAGRKELYECQEFIEVRGERAEIRTAGERHLLRDRAEDEGKGKYREALLDLFDWLENSEASLYALLGDYGMGKTFTCRIFAQRLAERCENEPHLPKPVYLDLRDVPTFVTFKQDVAYNHKFSLDEQDDDFFKQEVTRQPFLEEMLNTILHLNGQDEAHTAKEIISAARKGKLLCIFDGLDEKLVYYTADMRSKFLKELLRIFPQDGQAKVKIVISCRTHHFETITQMDGFLLGLNRSGLSGGDYRALNLLPFSAEQMQALLTKLLGEEEARQIFAFIEDEAYLKDLAQRPFLLRQLSRLLPKLRELKSQGKPINAAGFYQALIEDCLVRDEEKNIIKPRHKQQLLTDLAAEFWQNSTQLWQIDRLNDWFCAWLNKQPELATQYSSVEDQLLEKDLRNSTLLVRFGERDFGFSHSSMQEFFLSTWLLRQWREGKTWGWQISELTLQFLCDHIALLDEKELEQFNHGLTATLAKPWSDASDLALKIIAKLADTRGRLPTLENVDLRETKLSGRKLRGLQGKTLLLGQAHAIGSQWIDCHFQRIEVGLGNISESIWLNCSWQKFNTIEIPPCACPTDEEDTGRYLPVQHGVTLANCHGNTTLQRPHIFPPANSRATEIFYPANWRKNFSGAVYSCCFSLNGSDILLAAVGHTLKIWDADGICIQTFQGHEQWVNNCSFSPNSSHIISASWDKSLKLWDMQGHCIATFQGHKKGGISCCFSPDGKYILSASWDKSLKLWDIQGRCISTFQGHEKEVMSCCFSPDGKYILSASWDKSLKLWDIQGRCISTFQGHEKEVMSCCFSPDGSSILSASNDNTLKLWDIQGRCISTFQGHEKEVMSCCFSPDGSSILSASNDNTLRLWNLAGYCLSIFQGHKGKVKNCCFNIDGSRILSASSDGTLRLWNLDGTTERILAVRKEQWYTAFFRNNQLEKIIGTELSWKMANFAKDGKAWTLDETGCFEWVPAQY